MKNLVVFWMLVVSGEVAFANSEWITTTHYTFKISDMKKVEEGDSFGVHGNITYDSGQSFKIAAECEDRKRGLNMGNFSVFVGDHIYWPEEIIENYRDPAKYIEVAVTFHKIACDKFYP